MSRADILKVYLVVIFLWYVDLLIMSAMVREQISFINDVCNHLFNQHEFLPFFFL